MAKGKFYVVWNGRNVGVYSDWDSCKMQIEGFKGAQYKSFPDRASAEDAFRNGYEASQQPIANGQQPFQPTKVIILIYKSKTITAINEFIV